MDVVGGSQTFERVVGEYREKVFRLACSLLGEEAAAEDATQEIFLKIWKGLPDFRGDSSLSTWIYAIARNACLTRRRIAIERRAFSLDEANAAEIPSHDPPPAADSDLRAAIDRLPTRYRQVLVLFYLEDRSYQQVALAMGLPMGTVKTFLHRAKKELAELLAAQNVRKESAIPWPALNSKI
ncbi:MAG: RNA polymerase sigma factor [Ignavibacteriota bacterium]